MGRPTSTAENLLPLLRPRPGCWSYRTADRLKQNTCQSSHCGWGPIRTSLIQVIKAIKWDAGWPSVCVRMCTVASVLEEAVFTEASLCPCIAFPPCQEGMSWCESLVSPLAVRGKTSALTIISLTYPAMLPKACTG